MIAAIENAVLARLAAFSDAGTLGYTYRDLETYPEDWDKWLTDKQGLVRSPAAWIGFRGWDTPPSDNDAPFRTGQFWLVLCAENARNETARRHGDPADPAIPGVYQLVEDAAALLDGHHLDLAIGGIRVGGCRPVRLPAAMSQKKVAMMAIELSVDFQLFAPTADQPGDFATFHVNWDIPGFGGIVPPIGSAAADASDDATDHVQLETLP
jgi:phage gp37-like protein